jgi:hypothetical protein
MFGVKGGQQLPNGLPKATLVRKAKFKATLVSITFHGDHLDASGNKLLQRAVTENLVVASDNGTTTNYASNYGDSPIQLKKPEWDVARNGDQDSHPVSYTRATQVSVEVKISFAVTGKPVQLKEIRVEAGAKAYVEFHQTLTQTVKDGDSITLTLQANAALPDNVDAIDATLTWMLGTDTDPLVLFGSSSHSLYVTMGTPAGGIESPSDNSFDEGGSTQLVSEARLRYACTAAKGKGAPSASVRDKEVADAIFMQMQGDGVQYTLWHRWEHDPLNHTWCTPKPTLHHYLWLCLVFKESTVGGECHNIGAAMTLACRVLGIGGKFEVGHMFPWPRRQEDAQNTARPVVNAFPIKGRYEKPYSRTHTATEPQNKPASEPVIAHGSVQENLVFLDGSGAQNNFEGVAKYEYPNGAATEVALYAIGDAIFDRIKTSGSPPADETAVDKNATDYYTQRGANDATGRPTGLLPALSWAPMQFMIAAPWNVVCRRPYAFIDPPWRTSPQVKNTKTGALIEYYFFWQE